MKPRRTIRIRLLRGLGPLMGLLALGAPLFGEPAICGRVASASEHRLAADSARFFHPLVTLLSLVAAVSDSAGPVHARPQTVLGWDALRGTALGGSIWMVRDRWMLRDDLRAGLDAPDTFLLRC
jgi:hypothetical protein